MNDKHITFMAVGGLMFGIVCISLLHIGIVYGAVSSDNGILGGLTGLLFTIIGIVIGSMVYSKT